MNLLKDLAGHWKLEEASGTRFDSLGINNLTDVNTVTQSTGKIGKAAEFLDSNDEVLTNANSSYFNIGTHPFTVSAWVYITDNSLDRTIVSQSNATGNQRAFQLRYFSGTGKLQFLVSGNGIASSTVEATSFGAIAENKWYHVIGMYDPDNDNIIIVANAWFRNVNFHSTGLFNSNAEFRLGNTMNSSAFTGRIDSVSYWKRTLSVEEINFLFNNGLGRDFEEFGNKGIYLVG